MGLEGLGSLGGKEAAAERDVTGTRSYPQVALLGPKLGSGTLQGSRSPEVGR